MKTDDKSYEEYLQGKFLPGRRQYLEYLVYPRYLSEFPDVGKIWDLGFGNGEFLAFCRKKGVAAQGIDSNPHFVANARSRGFKVELDDITRLQTIADGEIRAAISDNVLEHLDRDSLFEFFRTLELKLARDGVFLAIVPGEKGFTRDPTHRTFIDEPLLRMATADRQLTIERSFRWPIGARWVSRLFYLNMTVFVVRRNS
jgi:trans-aconitate methyltransferase